MKESVAEVLSRLRPYVERDGADLEIFFVDEDFGIVELLLRRRPDALEESLRSVRYSVEQMLLRQVSGIRQVEFIIEAPVKPDKKAGTEQAHTAKEIARLRAGAGLVSEMLSDLENSLREDHSAKRLKRQHSAEHLLYGSFHDWLETAARDAGPERASSSEEAMPHLREAYFNLDRAGRALARTLESEVRAWEADGWPVRDDDLPGALRATERGEFEQLLRILEDLRPLLGNRTLDGFLSSEGKTAESDAPPTVALLDRIFKDALSQKVRDVYLDLGKSTAVLQYRIGRRIKPILSFNRSLYPSLVARIKHLASLDVSDRHRRQEGLICFTASSGYGGLTVQVQTIPDQFAERVRFRLHLPSERPKVAR